MTSSANLYNIRIYRIYPSWFWKFENGTCHARRQKKKKEGFRKTNNQKYFVVTKRTYTPPFRGFSKVNKFVSYSTPSCTSRSLPVGNNMIFLVLTKLTKHSLLENNLSNLLGWIHICQSMTAVSKVMPLLVSSRRVGTSSAVHQASQQLQQ